MQAAASERGNDATVKRLLAIMILPVLILCSGCSNANTPPPKLKDNVADSLMQPFESTVVLDYGNLSAAGYFCRKPPSFCMIEFSKPSEIAGLKVEIDGETATASYKGVIMKIDPSTIPGNAALKIISAAVDSAAQREGIRVAYEDDVINVSGENDVGSFILKIDKENGNILKLSSPDNKLDVRFTGFKFLN